eukprot:gnl/MRDRNA2_/MRDRNA2_77332_c0_seq1.p1 gnl/MRDRNA2_/MRDRNA2_77332_c0~~gnl/MRDRNA2_/MRDRNA2_77332_c0_seq1.p1  ORF type:complete len:144 (+),score=14.10 gnl/MRDRNA2_/MRDRNA2_77332_c0_seq1:61-492(+)
MQFCRSRMTTVKVISEFSIKCAPPLRRFGAVSESLKSIDSRQKDGLSKLTHDFYRNHVSTGRIKGATVVICRKNDVVYREHFGNHLEDSLYNMYSMTKIITTVACLQLAEQGKLHLDDPVCKHLPSFKQSRKVGLSNSPSAEV